MTGKAKDILKMDLYGLLDVDITATSKEIKKAYRQKALTCHPDKNPDNPKAVDLFYQLSQALEVLTDAAAKITRLREEGSRQLQEEQKLIREQIQREREASQTGGGHSGAERCFKSNVTPKLKLKWKCKKDDETNGGYTQGILFTLLQKYGDVSNVIVSSKKRGSAVVEFATVRAAELAAKNEIGLSKNPLKISWLEGQPEVIAPASQPGQFMSSQGAIANERDYESVVMMKMRQAAERQKLIEQMQRDDDEEAARS
ncbi:DnaJ subfamily C member 17 [Liparis tanakae]|uniref:DnaJ subfamily C member 17 n=1 Tax=Liparis tanakae TaxID=230148 RepID=A0A4Z2JBH1_9TELE|nr:DnaJ subfamily C member 17 [Liparis tanakae]